MKRADTSMMVRATHSRRSGCEPGPVRRPLRWLAAAAAVLAIGCGTGENRAAKPVAPAAERLLAIGVAYSRFNFERGGPPRGPEDLRELLAGADLFTSPRDSEPFVVFWGVDLRRPLAGATGRPILAHERTGGEGGRYVLTTMRHVELLAEDEFRASSFPPQPSAR